MPLPEAFLHFLRAGTFYGIGIGRTLHDVRQALGPETASRPFDTTLSLRWDTLPAELHFDTATGVLWWMELDLSQVPPSALLPDLQDFSPETVARYLTTQDIPYTERPAPATDDEPAVRYDLPNAIELQFRNDPDTGTPTQLEAVGQSNALIPHLLSSANTPDSQEPICPSTTPKSS